MDNNEIKITVGPDRSWTATPKEAADITLLLDDMALLTQADEHEAKGHHKVANLLRSLVLDSEPDDRGEHIAELEKETASLKRQLAMAQAWGKFRSGFYEKTVGKLRADVVELQDALSKSRRAAEMLRDRVDFGKEMVKFEWER